MGAFCRLKNFVCTFFFQTFFFFFLNFPGGSDRSPLLPPEGAHASMHPHINAMKLSPEHEHDPVFQHRYRYRYSPGCRDEVGQGHISGAKFVEHTQSCQTAVYGMSSLDTDQAGNLLVIESVHDT